MNTKKPRDLNERTALERETTHRLLDYIHEECGEVPVLVAAGALLRASVMLVRERTGPQQAPRACRSALENVLADLVSPERVQ